MNPESPPLPADHAERMERVRPSFDGLSIGDGFGDCFFGNHVIAERRIRDRDIPPPPWFVTDDSVMARNVARSLDIFGRINQDWLAQAFADAYECDPRRGYGGTAHGILQAIGEGVSWQEAAGRVFDGDGSCGNGGAMRSAPVGAYFAGDPRRVTTEARASASVTHAHEDGQGGAIAVALAAAWMVREHPSGGLPRRDLMGFVIEWLPDCETRRRIGKALSLPLDCRPVTVANVVGSGLQVISQDTVAFCSGAPPATLTAMPKPSGPPSPAWATAIPPVPSWEASSLSEQGVMAFHRTGWNQGRPSLCNHRRRATHFQTVL